MMIDLSLRENGKPICVNKKQIVYVEDGVHETIIHLSTGEELRVRQSYLEVIGWIKSNY